MACREHGWSCPSGSRRLIEDAALSRETGPPPVFVGLVVLGALVSLIDTIVAFIALLTLTYLVTTSYRVVLFVRRRART